MKKLITVILLLVFSGVSSFAQDESNIEVQKLTQSTISWDGSQLPDYPAGQPEITILRITIPPGVRLPMHKHPVINAGVLLKGKLTVISENGDTLRLNAGDAIVELVEKWHFGKNEGDEPAEIIVFYAGTPGTPVTAKK